MLSYSANNNKIFENHVVDSLDQGFRWPVLAPNEGGRQFSQVAASNDRAIIVNNDTVVSLSYPGL